MFKVDMQAIKAIALRSLATVLKAAGAGWRIVTALVMRQPWAQRCRAEVLHYAGMARRKSAPYIERYPVLKRIEDYTKDPSLMTELYYDSSFNRFYASAGYIPFAGWLFPLYLKNDDGLCRHHALNGLLLSMVFTSFALFLFLFSLILVPRDWRVLRFSLVVLLYLTYAVYFTICALGACRAVKEKRLEIPQADQYIHALDSAF
jgi:hypothetical protein